MQRSARISLLCLCVITASNLSAGEKADIQALLSRPIIGPELSMQEVREYTAGRVPPMPEVKTVAEWERHAKRMRADALAKSVLKGRAARWRTAKTRVEFLETIPGGPGYRIRKLRYEALPGLWIPALLYEPEKLAGKVPVIMNVNGHDGKGKAADYKQIRCINQVKRGMIALNVEWFGMGQLRIDNFQHYRLNQLDLCGTAGLAPFYLSLSRGIDLLLAHPHADPRRVGVTGLSGGGCQTILISSLDERVTLADPVAGYSSFRTRADHLSDLGDSEQTPVDLAVHADYAQLTALRAPRPTLLTYNAQDDCCFKAEHALPPLLQAAQPIFKLYGQEQNLRSHVNTDPGTHNYEKDNRQQLYRLIGDFFYPGDKGFDAAEIACDDEMKSAEELLVKLPDNNADFHTLAVEEMKDLPRKSPVPTTAKAVAEWQKGRRAQLAEIVVAKSYRVEPTLDAEKEQGDVTAGYWKLKIAGAWTVPAVELVKGKPESTVILVADAGRVGAAKTAKKLLDDGHRVLAVDPFYFGESKIKSRDFLYALLVSAVGDRPIGIQASQLTAIARWAAQEFSTGPVRVVAVGHRSSTFALVAAALETAAIGAVELHGSLGSLKQVIEENRQVTQSPELFCFGLLEAFDVAQIAELAAPRPVRFISPSDRLNRELAGLEGLYRTLGSDFQPLQ